MEDMPTKEERNDIQIATLYDLRLTVKASQKDNYTKEEVLELIDTTAETKRQK